MLHVALLGLAIGTAVGLAVILVQLVVGGSRIATLTTVVGDPHGPMVSIIVAARDEGPHIERALQSLLAQQYDELEIIAIDDRSADDTGKILDRMATQNQRLRVLHITELPPHWLGKNHALHQGAAIASGDYLLFTDADVVFAADAVARSVAFARSRNIDHLTMGPELDSPGLWLTLVIN